MKRNKINKEEVKENEDNEGGIKRNENKTKRKGKK
jgi:hypothetical protein